MRKPRTTAHHEAASAVYDRLGRCSISDIGIIANAIDRAAEAATMAEREAIIEIVDTAPLSNHSSEPATANKIMADRIVRAIRKREAK